MAKLGDRIENALNEARMLILGGQVLLGFSYRIVFERGFLRLPAAAQLAELCGLAITTAALAWLIWPTAFHQIAERGKQTESIHRLATTVLDWGLLPFAIGLGLGLYPVAVALQVGRPLLIAIVPAAFALLIWYGYAFLGRFKNRRQHPKPMLVHGGPQKEADLGDRIKKVMIECRMALPGAQAFLGFQFAIVFTEGFETLSPLLRWVHFASMLSIIVATIVLIAPAAYHRLAEHGEDTETMHKVASRFLLAGLVFLGPGMAGDLLVALAKVTGTLEVPAAIAITLLLACYGLWFGVSLWRSRRL